MIRSLQTLRIGTRSGRFITTATVALVACVSGTSAQQPALPTTEDAVVLIRSVSSLRTTRGSGFLIGDGSWAVTASHVVAVDMGKGRRLSDRTVLVYSPWTGRPYEAKVAAIDGVADIALLKLPQAGLPSLPVEGLELKDPQQAKAALENRPLRLFGFPLTFGEATVAALARPQHNDSQLDGIRIRTSTDPKAETSLATLRKCPDVQPGWSGGPIVSADKGSVIAVFHSLYRPPEQKEGFPAGSVSGYLGDLLKKAGATDLSAFSKVAPPTIPRDPKGAERMAHEMRSLSWAASGEWRRASEEQQGILKLFPQDAAARVELGRLQLADKQYEASLKTLEEAAKLAPESIFAGIYLSRAYHLNYDPRGAVRTLEGLMKTAPDEIEPYLILAEIHEANMKVAEAEAVLRRGQAQAVEHPILLFRLGQLLVQTRTGTPAEIAKREEQGLDLLKQASQLASQDAALSSIPLGYARILETKRKFREAESIYRQALRTDPENAYAYYYLAQLFVRLNRAEEAQLQLNAGFRLSNLPDSMVEAFRALQVRINDLSGSDKE